jgi:hypothetical protein
MATGDKQPVLEECFVMRLPEVSREQKWMPSAHRPQPNTDHEQAEAQQLREIISSGTVSQEVLISMRGKRLPMCCSPVHAVNFACSQHPGAEAGVARIQIADKLLHGRVSIV